MFWKKKIVRLAKERQSSIHILWRGTSWAVVMVGCATLLLVTIDLASVQLCGSAYTQCQVSCSCLCNRVLPMSLCFITLVSPRSPGTCTGGALFVASVCVACGWGSCAVGFSAYLLRLYWWWRGGINCVCSAIQSIQGRKSFIVQHVMVFIIFLAWVLLEIRQRSSYGGTCLGCLGRTEHEQRAEPDVDLARYSQTKKCTTFMLLSIFLKWSCKMLFG